MQNRPPLDRLRDAVPDGDIGDMIGEGGFKIVYRFQIQQQTEALKIVHIPRDERDETVREENIRRLMREIRLLASCESPFLVKLGLLAPTQVELEGEDYVVYTEELLEGDSIRDRIGSGHAPSLKEIASVGRCCLLVVADLWRQATIHRDIKPDNIVALRDPDRPFVLLDLGVAFVVGGTPLTRDPRQVPGTLYYLAPEMLEPNFRNNLDHRADMYAIGLTLYEYASGVNPFARREDPAYSTLQRIHQDTPPSLRSLRPDLPEELCELVDQLLKKLPALRPNIRRVIQVMEGYL